MLPPGANLITACCLPVPVTRSSRRCIIQAPGHVEHASEKLVIHLSGRPNPEARARLRLRVNDTLSPERQACAQLWPLEGFLSGGSRAVRSLRTKGSAARR